MRRLIIALLMLALLLLVLWVYLGQQVNVISPAVRFFLQNSLKDTGATNAVTAIYLNYRVFDTLFETLLLLVCAAAVIHLSWKGTRR